MATAATFVSAPDGPATGAVAPLKELSLLSFLIEPNAQPIGGGLGLGAHDALASVALLDLDWAFARLIASPVTGPPTRSAFWNLVRAQQGIAAYAAALRFCGSAQAPEGGTSCGAGNGSDDDGLPTEAALTACALLLCVPAPPLASEAAGAPAMAPQPQPQFSASVLLLLLGEETHLRDLVRRMLYDPEAPKGSGIRFAVRECAARLAHLMRAPAGPAAAAVGGASAAGASQHPPLKRRRLSREDRRREFNSERQVVQVTVAGQSEPLYLNVRVLSPLICPPPVLWSCERETIICIMPPPLHELAL